ncbi:CRISPR-associated endonuclease Cas2 [Desulfurobacterium atlanticum]|uniref:CRISPR-associated endoribonuclease Cas2 n=1 Tax=Desulfurobacterium atlanticum TaxID=240169 RepID=A0A238XXQ1_9BACT|nr:CRISPR-associated endonuclease Cas2 [Desulfurobacterium atlanticum]SNR63114.1 CRISPR-associated protein, Cas2 family [Desulfurobacterium atlanticum]
MKYKFSNRITTYIIIYDILSDDVRGWVSLANRRRAKISRILLEYGMRTQKSVFELEITSKKEFSRMIKRLEKTMNKHDKVYIYPIDSKNKKKIKRLGYEIETDFFF